MSVLQAYIDRIIELIDPDLTHIALGTGSGSTFVEGYRKAATKLIDGNTLIKEIELDPSEAVGTWTQVAMFGNGASDTPGSGVQMTHDDINLEKSSTESVTISIETEFGVI